MQNSIAKRYILITPAYNEENNLSSLIDSVACQNITPFKWIIVNDGSNDHTENIIEEASSRYPFIVNLSLNRDLIKTYYSRKVHVFNKGFNYVKESYKTYDFIGNLDADIVLPKNYYEEVIKEFNNNKKLGIVGGSYQYVDGTTDIWGGNYIPGPILFFRKDCFFDINGYRALRFGAEDTLACIMAEEKGWYVKYIPELRVIQKRKWGVVGFNNLLIAKFYQGISEYDIGYSEIFSFLKAIKRCFLEKPLFLNGLSRYLGYLYAHIIEEEKLVPAETKKFLKKKQIKRILQGR